MVDISWTIYEFKNNGRYFFKDIEKMRDISNFIEINKSNFEIYINDTYGTWVGSNLFGNFESGKGYYSSNTSFRDYFKDDILEIKDLIADKCKQILKEGNSMKSQVKEMEDFINKYHLNAFIFRIGDINKRSSNKSLDSLREDYLPYENEIINGVKNILGYEYDDFKKAFEILKLDNQIIKENA